MWYGIQNEFLKAIYVKGLTSWVDFFRGLGNDGCANSGTWFMEFWNMDNLTEKIGYNNNLYQNMIYIKARS